MFYLAEQNWGFPELPNLPMSPKERFWRGAAHTAPLSPGEGESDGVGNETLTIPLPSGASSDTLVKRKGKSLEKGGSDSQELLVCLLIRNPQMYAISLLYLQLALHKYSFNTK